MKETWRWFGPKDPISLQHIKQAGATGIVTSLHHIKTGDVWPMADILERKKLIEDSGLEWAVIESIPLHNDIKTRTGNYQQLIENYKQSIRNVAAAGVYDVCYNFMPVVDWTRTNLTYTLPNNAQALRFEMSDFAAYDVYMLKRPGAETSYKPDVLAKAKARLDAMTDEEKTLLEKNIIAGLPGGEGSYDRDGIRAAIDQFIKMGDAGMRANLFSFLREIVPVAEEVGVRMAIHPDDPPFSLFGLPRVVSTADDARALLNAAPSPANGLVAMAREFGERIYFVHLRNIKREEDGSFFESDHLDGNNDMVGLIDALLSEEQRRQQAGVKLPAISMRPDHGHLMGDDLGKTGMNPGYSYTGRMKGLAELRGVIHALTTLRERGLRA
jgi:mannonate dehydratase